MKTFGLIGHPLTHSFSKKYFTEKFLKEGVDAEYINFEISDLSKIPDILEKHPNLSGLNVTIPYKQSIIPHLHKLSEDAQTIGAVNCIRIDRKEGIPFLTGYNTDAEGFRKSLCGFIPTTIREAIILGNGGAARAVKYTLDKLHINSLIASRTPRQTNEIAYSQIPLLLHTHKLIINTTPLGMFPDTESFPPLPYEQLNSDYYLFDLIYNPELTAFLRKGRTAGASVKNGWEMLITQAEEAWKKWN